MTRQDGRLTDDLERKDAAGERTAWDQGRSAGGSALIYCGLCGALNPASSYYCAACGTTLVDAFHATEGLRVFERPDPAARLIEILPSGGELEVIEDAAAPVDWVRIRLPSGRLGYVRIGDAAGRRRPAGSIIGISSPRYQHQCAGLCHQ